MFLFKLRMRFANHCRETIFFLGGDAEIVSRKPIEFEKRRGWVGDDALRNFRDPKRFLQEIGVGIEKNQLVMAVKQRHVPILFNPLVHFFAAVDGRRFGLVSTVVRPSVEPQRDFFLKVFLVELPIGENKIHRPSKVVRFDRQDAGVDCG